MWDKVHCLAETSSLDLDGSELGQEGAGGLWRIQLGGSALEDLKIVQQYCNRHQTGCPKTSFPVSGPSVNAQLGAGLFPLNSFSAVY